MAGLSGSDITPSMMTELYTNISIFASSGLLLTTGIMLLFGATDRSPLLGNYRRARRAIAGAYLFFAVVNAAEYLFGGGTGAVSGLASDAMNGLAETSITDPANDIQLIRAITLAIAASQAFLFTFAMLALLDVRFPGWRAILREAAPALTLIAAVFVVYFACSERCFEVAFRIFAVIYALLLVRYTMLFVRNYRRFRRRMENWFSDNEADRLRWVAFSFYAALVVGIGALATSVFTSTTSALIFTGVFDLFYLFFAVRFTGYAHRFATIGEAMESDTPEEADQGQQDELLSPAIVSTIETALKNWTQEKLFLTPSVKIGEVAGYAGTNSKYLSLYINNCMGRTFHEWIGGLRIDEAKHLLTRHPEMTVEEVARRVGIPDKSNFIRQFTKHTHIPPSVWRKREQK